MAVFVARMVCGLVSANGIWQKRIAQASDPGHTPIKVASEVRKLQRFFNNTPIDYQALGAMIWDMIKADGTITILIDRTNWDYGQSHINFLVASVLYRLPDGKSFAIPLVWEVFDKTGNSNTHERETLMQRVREIIGDETPITIIGDREFIGDDWLTFLFANNTSFLIRLKHNMYVNVNGNRVRISTLVANATETNSLIFNVTLGNIPIKLAAKKSTEGELVIVAATRDIEGDPLEMYRLRWFIELFFKASKSQGFKLEETHMVEPSKIKKLFALIALATLYAVRAGIARHKHVKPIVIKKHGRPAFSLFTYGLDFLRALFRGEEFKLSSSALVSAGIHSDPGGNSSQVENLLIALCMG